MSTVLELDGTTYVVRHGMHDDKKEKCFVWFFRNGKRSIISVSGDDVRETTFYGIWRPLLEEVDSRTPAKHNFVERWRRLATCVIMASLPKLRELAPDKEHWITLRDHLHTYSYRLEVVKTDGADEGVAVEVAKGPEDNEFQPYGTDIFGGLPKDIPRVESPHLTVLDRERNWRVPPHKVKTLDGLVCRCKGWEKPTRSAGTNQTHYFSRDTIECCLISHRILQRLAVGPIPGLPIVLELVMNKREAGGRKRSRHLSRTACCRHTHLLDW